MQRGHAVGLKARWHALLKDERAQLWLTDWANPNAYPLALKSLLDRPRRVRHGPESELALRNAGCLAVASCGGPVLEVLLRVVWYDSHLPVALWLCAVCASKHGSCVGVLKATFL